MNALRLAAVAAAVASLSAVAASPFDAFKGKMKEGMYDYKMEMDMGSVPGMPPGMAKQTQAFQQCVTNQDIDKGGFSRGREAKMPENCEIRDFKMSGSSATYVMECKSNPAMKADSKITFVGDGFNMDVKMAMNQGGQVMNVTQKMTARYVGPCKK